jgi:cobalt-zinc-cadmium efflux system membrane fusion protein
MNDVNLSAESRPVASSVPRSKIEWLLQSLPTLLVFLALGGLLAWGKSTGWTLPKFSSWFGETHEHEEPWCDEHSVPMERCIECHPDLLPRARSHGWCEAHGVHECVLCHPELAQTASLVRLTREDRARAEEALAFSDRIKNNSRCKLAERRIQFESDAAVAKAGVEVEPVWTKAMTEAVAGTGEIAYDATRTARLSARVPGVVFQVCKQVGDVVQRGDVLVVIDAAEVGKAKSELLQAMIQYKLKAKHLEDMQAAAASIPERAIREMEASVSEARVRLTSARESMTNLGLAVDVEPLLAVPQESLANRLRLLGLPREIADGLDPQTTTSNLIALTAPFDGTVVERKVVDREVVDAARVIFTVIDVRRMWLTMDLRAEDAARVTLGKEVVFNPDGGVECRGRVAWISTEADHKTRTVKIRADLDNANGRLRANTFGTGRVILRETKDALVVPNSAVHWDGCCQLVFVRDKDYFKDGGFKVFHVRTVRTGARDHRDTEILVGLLPGEVVAAGGSGVLRAELLKSKLGEGEGCCGSGKK